MTLVCSQCSRVNPADATYCYWDGAVLAGRTGAGPINAGSAPFPGQFIFPSGHVCRNFDQLATTCQQHWQEAVDLLKQGFLASFLGGMGRADLAMAANEAAKFPDADRGLDMLLSRLPSQVLQAPKLKADPSEINLGQLKMGADRNVDLHLTNMGMRLLYGTVSSDSKWLTFGEGAGAAQKLFQFGHDTVIPVHVKGQHLRAGNQPLEGQLIIESNGGNVTVVVKADVPITAFSEGVLAGSYTPRQIAEKARANPKEAAALFERGLVAQWFAKNGWIYPVQGPTVAGMGGVQQFFEALGLAKPPKVDLKTPQVQLRGNVGQALSAQIDVGTSERKQVYAWAVSDQPWVDVSRTKNEGRNSSIAVTVTVPHAPGQSLHANITVTCNGNQKFVVPLSLMVGGTIPPGYVPAVQAVPMPSAPVMAMPMSGSAEQPIMAGVPAGGNPFAFSGGAPAPMPVGAPPPVVIADDSDGTVVKKKRESYPLWIHLTPLGILAAVLLGLMIRDLIFAPSGTSFGEGAPIDPTMRLLQYFDYGKDKNLTQTMRFGLVKNDPGELKKKQPDLKHLTFHAQGLTNSTVVQIDGTAMGFGWQQSGGKWVGEPRDLAGIGQYKSGGKSATWDFVPTGVRVTQTVEIAPGEEIDVGGGEYKRPLDTSLVRYKIENKDGKPHNVGIRVMIDTLIGKNDGTPFTIPGGGLVSTQKDFPSRESIPDFIQALEEPNLENPGTTVQMNLKLSDRLAPDRVSLTRWPGWNKSVGLWSWDVPMENIFDDSCIVMYWNAKELKPNESREIGFSYGLGNLSQKGGRLALTVGGSLVKGGELTVVAYIADPQGGQTATLVLPEGSKDGKGELLRFINPGDATQPVPPAEKSPDGRVRPSPVTWRIRAVDAGSGTIQVRTSNGIEQSRKISIKTKGIF